MLVLASLSSSSRCRVQYCSVKSSAPTWTPITCPSASLSGRDVDGPGVLAGLPRHPAEGVQHLRLAAVDAPGASAAPSRRTGALEHVGEPAADEVLGRDVEQAGHVVADPQADQVLVVYRQGERRLGERQTEQRVARTGIRLMLHRRRLRRPRPHRRRRSDDMYSNRSVPGRTLWPWPGRTTRRPRRCRSTPSCSRSTAATPSGCAATSGRRRRSPATPRTLRRRRARVPGVGEAIAQQGGGVPAPGRLPPARRAARPGARGGAAAGRVPTLGPKTALVLYPGVGIDSPEALAEAIRAGRLDRPQGVRPEDAGEPAQRRGAAARRRAPGAPGRRHRPRRAGGRLAARGAGRRARRVAGVAAPDAETIGDIELLATAADPAALVAVLRGLPYVAEVSRGGAGRRRCATAAGPRCDLRLVPAEAWGAALLATSPGRRSTTSRLARAGRRARLEALRTRPVRRRRGCRGRRPRRRSTRRSACRGCRPSCGRTRGEVEAALRGELPRLVTLDGPARRPAHPHRPHRRGRVAGGHGGRGRRGAATPTTR